MNSNISRAGETTPPLPENEHPLSHSSASAAALEGVPVSEAQPQGRTHFRLTQNGWEKRRRDANGAFLGDWQKTRELEPFKDKWTYVGESEPDELQRDALAVFGQSYNRVDDIARKKSLYEKKLKSLQPSSDRAKFLTKLIPLFDRAIAYQNEIMWRLLEPRNEECEGLRSKNEAERAAAERQAILKDSIRLENILKINNRPNQVERLIEQIEKEEAERLDAQKRLAQVQARLAIPGQSLWTLSSLNSAAGYFQSAIAVYPEFIEARLDSARLIQAPYKKTEEIDPAIQDQIKASKEDLLKKQALAQSFYRLGKNCFTKSRLDPRAYILTNIDAERNYLLQAIREVRRDQPRQTVIDLFLRAACLEEKAAALDSQDGLKRFRQQTALSLAAISLFRAGKEAQKDEPRQTVIDLFLRAFSFHERAFAALDNENDLNRDERLFYLNSAGISLFDAAIQAQKATPDTTAIESRLEDSRMWESKAEALSKYYSSCSIN